MLLSSLGDEIALLCQVKCQVEEAIARTVSEGLTASFSTYVESASTLGPESASGTGNGDDRITQSDNNTDAAVSVADTENETDIEIETQIRNEMQNEIQNKIQNEIQNKIQNDQNHAVYSSLKEGTTGGVKGLTDNDAIRRGGIEGMECNDGGNRGNIKEERISYDMGHVREEEVLHYGGAERCSNNSEMKRNETFDLKAITEEEEEEEGEEEGDEREGSSGVEGNREEEEERSEKGSESTAHSEVFNCAI